MGEQRQWRSEAHDFLAATVSGDSRDALSLSAVAKAAGVSRSRLYAFWDTSSDLAEDVLATEATSDTTWLARAVDDTSVPVLDALEAAVRDHDGSAALRATISVHPPRSRSRSLVAAWERHRLEALADRLRTDHAAVEAGLWFETAVAVVAYIEGMLLLLPAHPSDSVLDVDEIGLTIETVRRIVPYLADAWEAAGEPPGPAPGPEPVPRPPGAERILAEVARAFAAGELRRDVAGRRIIDLATFARHAGVSTRHLFDLWPEATDLNLDLLEEAMERTRLDATARSLEAFSSAVDHSNPTALLLRANERNIDLDEFPAARTLLRTLEIAGSPLAATRWTSWLQAFLTESAMSAAALLGATGRRILPGASIYSHTLLSGAAHVGLWRMAAMHESILARPVAYLGVETLAGAAALDAHSQVWTEPVG